MNCSKILDMVYEYSGEEESSVPLLSQIQIWLHTLICPDCAQEIERFEVSREILREDFFPFSPGLEDSIMARVAAEEELPEASATAGEIFAVPGGLSTRGWVIAGLIILVSLATVFFGLDFQKLAHETGMSFLLPVGITIGIVLTTYGALFIGSHLKELSERFGL
ncbi:MAG: peptidoglycan-binding protein [Treponema sp.]|jgi:hypothetical protein|nr:peptidoglycan-binding protein [Treponema sp.]